jgi:hypothetical protein
VNNPPSDQQEGQQQQLAKGGAGEEGHAQAATNDTAGSRRISVRREL